MFVNMTGSLRCGFTGFFSTCHGVRCMSRLSRLLRYCINSGVNTQLVHEGLVGRTLFVKIFLVFVLLAMELYLYLYIITVRT